MALIKCWECGKEMSDSAMSCPSCGAKNKEKKSLIIAIGTPILFFLIILIVFDFTNGHPILNYVFNSGLQYNQTQDDISAIRKAIAPTPQQQAIQQQQQAVQQQQQAQLNAQAQAKSQKAWTDYNNCIIPSAKKQSDYLNKICNFSSMNNDYTKWSDCSAKVRDTAAYKQLGCTMPTNF